METLFADFYAGFEGEPEVNLVRQGAARLTLKVWDGYFSQVLDAIEPGDDGQWHGLVLYYHLGTGWYDSEDFEVEDVPLFASQLSALDKSGFEPKLLYFYETLLLYVLDAVTQKDRLLIQYF